MQELTIDLKKNPEVADAISELALGDEIAIYATIKAKDDQKLIVRLSEVEAGEESEESEDAGEMDDEEDEDYEDETPSMVEELDK